MASVGAPVGPVTTVIPVILNKPLPVSILAEGLPTVKLCSCATVNTVPPIVTLLMPSGALALIVPVAVSVVSPTVSKPFS